MQCWYSIVVQVATLLAVVAASCGPSVPPMVADPTLRVSPNLEAQMLALAPRLETHARVHAQAPTTREE